MDPNILAFSTTHNVTDTKLPGYYRSRLYTTNVNINPLIAACDPILTLVSILKTIEPPNNYDKFLQDFIHEIHAFKHRAQLAHYSTEVINAAHLALCNLIDETMATITTWNNNEWPHNNYRNQLYNNVPHDLNFYAIVDQVLDNTYNNLHLIELLYLCLALGFTGKHCNPNQENIDPTIITDKLYQAINQHRRLNINDQILFIANTNQESASSPNNIANTLISLPQIKTKKLLGITIIIAVIFSLGIYLGTYLKLHNTSKSLYPLINHQLLSPKQYPDLNTETQQSDRDNN